MLRSFINLAAAALFLLQPADLSLLAPAAPAARLLAPARSSVGPASVACERCSVVLVSIDTLRADHLGVYGYPWPTSPHLDRLAGESAVFRTAISHASSTLPSHASLLSGLLPSQHQAARDRDMPLSPSATTLAEVLSGVGFATAAFTGRGQMDPAFGLGQGFATYESTAGRRFRGAAASGLRWIDRLAGERFFLFLHSYEVHGPYDPEPDSLRRLNRPPTSDLPEKITPQLVAMLNSRLFDLEAIGPQDAAHVARSYDAEIRQVDDGIGALVAGLRQRDLLDRVLLIVTADHGEEFGEHGRVGVHAYSLYDEVLRVPLVVRLPGAAYADRHVQAQVRLIDVAPTVLDAIGVQFALDAPGRSLLPLLAGEDRAPRPALSSRYQGSERRFSVRTNRWKLLNGRLFDLGRDPGETTDVADRFPLVRAGLLGTLDEFLGLPRVVGAEPIQLDEDLREQLRALGYVR